MIRILGISGSLRAGSVFGADGALQDEAARRQLADYLEGFVAFVAAQCR